jgi:glucuronate isomerase
LLEAAMIRCTCNAIRGKTKVYQLVYGTQFPTGGLAHGIARSNENFATGLAHLLYEYGDLHFNILSGYEPHEPILCSLCLAYSNISLGGFWWGMFYPSVMHAAWSRRLDMVPTTRLMGFFSDAYCIDWMYGRLRMTQRVLANVLAEKIEQGFYTRKQALKVAGDILHDTPRSVMLANETLPIPMKVEVKA